MFRLLLVQERYLKKVKDKDLNHSMREKGRASCGEKNREFRARCGKKHQNAAAQCGVQVTSWTWLLQ